MNRFATLAVAAAVALASLTQLYAQTPHPAPQEQSARQGQGGPRQADRPPSEARRLPADSVTHHVLELPGRTLRFTATAGSFALSDGQGNLQAEIAYVAYTRPDADPASRPVTFALNGGPGAASAYLHLGVLGPWRLPLDGPTISPSASPELVPNAETWLDFTDLVFIDPVGTGYSRAVGSNEDIRNRYFNIEGDIGTLSEVIGRWLRAQDRLLSPKFFVGESYGGFRGPKLADKLRSDQGVALNGLVLLSPVLDFAWLSQPRHNAWIHAARLPSLVAAAREAKGPVTRQDMADAEAYARGDYLTDLTRGLQDKEAVERASRRVADLTGLDPEIVRRRAGRLDTGTFQREFLRSQKRIASAYDAGVSAYDPDPTAAVSNAEDAVLAAMTPPLTSAIVDHLSRRLNYKVDAKYNLLNGGVNGSWRWGGGRGQAEAMSDLRQTMALDATFRVLVVHGFTDLVTPYFANQLLLDQLPDYGAEKRIGLSVYPGGHMFYSRDGSRTAFRQDAAKMYDAALAARSMMRNGP
jgi:carboxypeptidase C (cathepsin A)